MVIALIREDLYSLDKEQQLFNIKGKYAIEDVIYLSDLAVVRKLNHGDTVVIDSILTLGSALDNVINNIEYILSYCSSLIINRDNIILSDDLINNGLAYAFKMMNNISISFYKALTKETLYIKKIKGKTLGRPKGSYRVNTKLYASIKEIKDSLLNKHIPMRTLAKQYDVNYGTMITFIKKKYLSIIQGY